MITCSKVNKYHLIWYYETMERTTFKEITQIQEEIQATFDDRCQKFLKKMPNLESAVRAAAREEAQEYIDQIDPKNIRCQYEINADCLDSYSPIYYINRKLNLTDPDTHELRTISVDLYHLQTSSSLWYLRLYNAICFIIFARIIKKTNKEIILKNPFYTITYKLSNLIFSENKCLAIYREIDNQFTDNVLLSILWYPYYICSAIYHIFIKNTRTYKVKLKKNKE